MTKEIFQITIGLLVILMAVLVGLYSKKLVFAYTSTVCITYTAVATIGGRATPACIGLVCSLLILGMWSTDEDLEDG